MPNNFPLGSIICKEYLQGIFRYWTGNANAFPSFLLDNATGFAESTLTTLLDVLGVDPQVFLFPFIFDPSYLCYRISILSVSKRDNVHLV